MDRARAREAGAATRDRSGRGRRGRGAPGGTRGRDDARGGRVAVALRRAQANRDPRPANALGIVLVARHALVQLAARGRAVRRARLRRRARAMPPARGRPLEAVLGARRVASPRLARAARLASRTRARSPRVSTFVARWVLASTSR